MSGQATVVLGVGKTLTKRSLWGADGRLIPHRNRLNERIEIGLDARGVETFVAESLEYFAIVAGVGAIIRMAHRTAAAVLGKAGSCYRRSITNVPFLLKCATLTMCNAMPST
jgi:hypothetical protein